MLLTTWRRATAACAMALAPFAAIHAENSNAYPDKPVTIVVGFPPGTSVDNVARILAEQFSKQWQQPVIVENRAGASGAIGAGNVARAKPDGYTLLLSSSGPMTINPHVQTKLTYEPLKDFMPIGQAAMLPYMLVTNAAFPASTLQEMVSEVKRHPGKYTFGSIGTGSTSHLIMSLMADAAKLDMVHVPYSGSSQVQTDVVAGNVDATFDTVVANITMVKNGRLKAIAVSTPQRSPLAPDVPTVAEQGYPGFSANAWLGFFAPAHTSPQIVEKIFTTLNASLQDPNVAKKLTTLGLEVQTSMSPAAFTQMVQSEYGRWEDIVQKIGVALN